MHQWSNYDFVWGAEASHVEKYHNTSQAGMVVSKYIPYAWAPDATQSLEYWQQTHPSWVLYKCDKKTPAWYPGALNCSESKI
jgi:hypothetical protein